MNNQGDSQGDQGENHKIRLPLLESLNLTKEEYQSIIKHLGREPNLTELAVFSVMWSEHCSYKSSKVHLKKFPTKGERVVQGPGENAGVIDIGDDQVVVFKMESHNHPSFIEPYQGAATGVGGILRDVFTMGARPILLLNSLRFGDPKHQKTKFLIEGVVSGIGGYGNCFGCPTVGGEVYFHGSYNLNPLVNAFCLGLAKKDQIFFGRADGVLNSVMYVGAKTGRDGIHGATMASAEFNDETESKKPTVQVGDPFTEKLLLEACLEAMSKGYVVGIQDMGAAGLTSSSVEMASRAGRGIFLDLSKIPQREENMRPDELLLSESQERMLLVIKPGDEEEVKKIFEKWDLDAAKVGRVTDDGRFRAEFRGEEVVNIPVKALTEASPVYDRPCGERPSVAPKALEERDASFASLTQHDISQPEWKRIFETLVASPNLCSRRWIYRQYDQQVKTNTVVSSGGDAAVIRIKGTDKGIAATTDCNSRICEIDPYQGGMMAVAEAARNLVCVGAQPIGVSDCLNFGNPENPQIMWQFKNAVEGISQACRFLEVPVVSGNVSFYNETNGSSIAPTPTISMVGLIPKIKNVMTHFFKEVGHLIVLIGEDINSSEERLGGSEYLSLFFPEYRGSLPAIDLNLEKRVHEAALELISDRLIQSAHDCSDGGLAMTILESAFEKEIGVNLNIKTDRRLDHLLFGESPSRIVVSMDKGNFHKFSEICKKYGVPYLQIGETIKDRFVWRPHFDLDVKQLKTLWENAFEKIVSH